ncbi:MAG: cysteine--tRNA ligase, partial [Arsenophonus sp.]
QFLQSKVKCSHRNEIEKIELLIKKRNDARKSKLWLEADSTRYELTQMGIILEDTPKGTIWRRR